MFNNKIYVDELIGFVYSLVTRFEREVFLQPKILWMYRTALSFVDAIHPDRVNRFFNIERNAMKIVIVSIFDVNLTYLRKLIYDSSSC
jgi:hypothetical protein